MKRYKTILKGLREKYNIQHWQIIAVLLIVYDLFAVSFAYFFTLWIRFDMRYSSIPAEYLEKFYRFLPVYLIICFVIFWFFRLYKIIWRYASLPEVTRIIAASGIASVLHVTIQWLMFGHMPLSYCIGGAILQFVLIEMFVTASSLSTNSIYSPRAMSKPTFRGIPGVFEFFSSTSPRQEILCK